MTHKIYRFGLILLLILGTGGPLRFNAPAKSLPPAISPANAEQWFKANTIVLTYASKSKGMAATLKMETNDGNDFLLTVSEPGGRARQTGSIMVIAGSTMLTKGLKLEKGYEIDELDSRVLMVQLTLNLLSRAFPNGPDSVGSDAEVNLVERHSAITTNTPSASLEMPPPWTLKGAARSAAAGQVEFKLSFTYSSEETPKAKETLDFSGSWQINPTTIALGDEMPLGGWQAFTLGPIKSESAGGTTYDYGASRMRQFATLGELRHSLQAQPPAQSTGPRKPGQAPKMTNNN